MATHNSYSGGIGGSRKTLFEQLDAGIRFLEIDIHAGNRNFLVGHMKAGHEVDQSFSNPSSIDLDSWLKTIAKWSMRHSRHVPVVLGLDVRSDLRNTNRSTLQDLENLVKNIFAGALYSANGFKEDEIRVCDLVGRVLVVLSGNLQTRLAYQNSPIMEKFFFVEHQNGEAAETEKALFYAASAKAAQWGLEQRQKGKIVRLWEFFENAPHVAVNFPATDHPFSEWYVAYCKNMGTIS